MIKTCDLCVHAGGMSKLGSASFARCLTCENYNNYEERKTIMEPKNNIEREAELWAIPLGRSLVNYSAISTDRVRIPKIKNVIFNEPATIVFWEDNTKTVVKTQNGEAFDPEKGLSMAITKKALGNKGNYFNEIKKWTDTAQLDELNTYYKYGCSANNFVEALADAAKKINEAIGSI